MNKKIKSFGVVAILIVAGIVIIQLPVSSAEVAAPFGEWQVQVGVYDTDGNYIPMEIESYGSQILSVFIDSTQISSVTYVLKARASGSGYDTCVVDFGDMFIGAKVCDGSDCDYRDTISGGVTTLTVGSSEFVTVFEYVLTAANIETNKPSGTYVVSFFPANGGVYYKGMPDGSWEFTSSIPGASTTVTIAEEEITCYKCDGAGGMLTASSVDGVCPDGYSSTMPDCTCYDGYYYGSFGAWADWQCANQPDCTMKQRRTRTIYYTNTCPPNDPVVTGTGTDTDYRNVYDSSCCDVTYITCYQCDGSGGVTSKQFANSCGSGWYSSPPNCACSYSYESRNCGPWEDHHCSGNCMMRQEQLCESWKGTKCPPSTTFTWVKIGTTTNYRTVYDASCCTGQIVSSNLFYTVDSGPAFTPYYVDAEHYLGVARRVR